MRKPHRDGRRPGPQKGHGRPSFSKSEGRRDHGRPGGHRAEAGSTEADQSLRWVVGIHSCEEVLRVRPKAVRAFYIKPEWEGHPALEALVESARTNRLRLEQKTLGQLDKIGAGHQGIAVGVAETPEVDWERFDREEPQTVLVLDGIEDPHNLGSILRTAWLTGVSAIFIPQDRAVGLTPAACKVATGGAEHVPVEAVTTFSTVIERLKEKGFWVYGLSEKGKRKPWEFQLSQKVVWVVGSEGQGMRVTTERLCDEFVRIPQVSSGSSYNASIAVAMAMLETCRQSGKPE